jgi:DUF4097 and DUF4098 domain-containing protein YvlB
MQIRNAGRLALLALAGAALPLAGQTEDEEWVRRCERDWGDRDRERVCEVRVETIPARGSLTIEGGNNGGASVIGWDRNEIEIHARIQAQAEDVEAARALARGVTFSTTGTIEADGPRTGRRESWHVTFVVYAPRNIDIDLRAHNGPVSASEVNGRLVLSTHNGPVSLRAVGGDVRAETRNGPISVELTGSRWEGRGLEARTQNGPATIEIPEGYNAELETGTVNGPMRVDFPMQVTLEGRVGRSLRTTLGSGGPELRITTQNGPLTLRRPR